MAKDRPGYFQVTSQGSSGWHWQLVTDTGQIIASSDLPIVSAERNPII